MSEKTKFFVSFFGTGEISRGNPAGTNATRSEFLRNVQKRSDLFCILLLVSCHPAGAHTVCLKAKDQVLGRCAAVFKVIFCITLPKNCKTDRCFCNEFSMIGHRSNFFEQVL